MFHSNKSLAFAVMHTHTHTHTNEWRTTDRLHVCVYRVLHGQVLHDTYSKDHAKAMAEVRRQLDEMNTSLDSRLASATATLRSYHSVGREFMQIASEYTQVKAEIENKKWALRELGKVEGRGQAPHR